MDHQITNQAVITAFRPIPGETLKALYSFEVPSSTEWQPPNNLMTFFRPDYFVDITKCHQTKLEALACYKQELRAYPHPRSIKAVEITDQAAGVQIGFSAAERFMTLRSIWH